METGVKRRLRVATGRDHWTARHGAMSDCRRAAVRVDSGPCGSAARCATPWRPSRRAPLRHHHQRQAPMTEIIEAWMQHPRLRHANHDMFESLRRWMGIETAEEPLP